MKEGVLPNAAELHKIILSELEESARVKQGLKGQSEMILKIAQAMIETLKQGGRIYFFGNGGSAADAQHLSAELVGQFQSVRAGLPAMALTVNPSVLTAIGNDFDFQEIFARQVEALVTDRDLVIGISTGGYNEAKGKFSKNVVRGIEEARKKGAKTVCLLGKGGGLLAKISDFPLVVASDNTQRIQEAHITLGHILCGLVDQGMKE